MNTLAAPNSRRQCGFALVGSILFLLVAMSLVSAYITATTIELKIVGASSKSVTGFYAAEAGLNMRAEDFRQKLIAFTTPTGTPPEGSSNCTTPSEYGTGDYQCSFDALGKTEIVTWVKETGAGSQQVTIPPGEKFQNLHAFESEYSVISQAKDTLGKTTALLELQFKTRAVPIYQFAAFYDKDLEILPGPEMFLGGPVHTNGDLYLDAGKKLTINGQITVGGDIYRGRKNDSSCKKNKIMVYDPVTPLALLEDCDRGATSRVKVSTDDAATYNGQIVLGVDKLSLPEISVSDPNQNANFFRLADLRLALKLNSSNIPDTTNAPTAIEVRNLDNTVNVDATDKLNDPSLCPGTAYGRSVGNSTSFYDYREDNQKKMLEIDIQGLLDCAYNQNILEAGRAINDDTQDGLVFHFTVDGPNSIIGANSYGVRLRDAEELQSSEPSAPLVKGLTIVTDQALYTWGDFNSTNKIPASMISDAYNVLSNAWTDQPYPCSGDCWSQRKASETTVNSAIVTGTDSTGDSEGPGGKDSGKYNGGLENYFRFHENWSGVTYHTYGSFVSLGNPRYSDGSWSYGKPVYTAPKRDYGYDTDFNLPENMPPMALTFFISKTTAICS